MHDLRGVSERKTGGQPAAEVLRVELEFLERLLRLRGPRFAVVVRDDDCVVGKFRLPCIDALALLRRGGHVHTEDSRLFENLPQDWRGHLPVVIVLSVHDEDFDFIPGNTGDGKCEKDQEE